MQILTNKLPKSQIECVFELSFEEFHPFLNQAVNKISNSVNISGFRAGTVPFEILKRHVPEMEIYEEAANLAISKTLGEYFKKEKIPFVGQPSIDIQKLAPNNPFVFRATISLLPSVKLPDFDTLPKISKQKQEVSAQEVDEALQKLQKSRRKEAQKSDPIASDDKALVDFEIYRENVLVENGKFKSFEVYIGEKQVIPGFEDQLIGLREGEEKTFELEFPKDSFRKELSGKKIQFRVKISEVFALELPVLDDAFAQGFGKFQNLDEFKTYIQDILKVEKVNKEELRFEQEMLKHVLANTEIEEVPETLIASEQKRMLHETKDEIERQRLSWEDYLTHVKQTEEALEAGYRAPALEYLKTGLLLRELGIREKITATAEEVEDERKKRKEMASDDYDLSKSMDSERYTEHLENFIVNRKVLQFLRSKVEAVELHA